MNRLIPLVLVLFALSIASPTRAEINISGFATLAGGLTFDDDESLQGYDDAFSFDANSLIALQASSDIGNGWGVTTQLMTRGSNDWEVDAEWAYVSYDVNDNWRLLLGRQRTPFYLYSDFLDVSYAYHWITPPTGVYNLPFDSVNGIGSIYNFTLADFDSSLHILYGRTGQDLEAGGTSSPSNLEDLFNIAWTLNRDWLTIRLSYAAATLDVQLDSIVPLQQGWAQAGFAHIGDRLAISDESPTFLGLGVILDFDDFIIITEYTEVEVGESIFPDQDSYYVSFGKRFDDMLVHLTYGQDEDKAKDLLRGVPVGVDPGLDFLIANTIGAIASNEQESNYLTLGMRWDVSDSVAFKVEYTNFEDDLITGNEASLLQIAITTVF